LRPPTPSFTATNGRTGKTMRKKLTRAEWRSFIQERLKQPGAIAVQIRKRRVASST